MGSPREISPADIPAFLSIYKDLYERAMDTLRPPSLSPSSLPPPLRETNVSPRGGPRGRGSTTSLWPRERENKAWSRQAWKRGRGILEDGPDKRKPTEAPHVVTSFAFRVFG